MDREKNQDERKLTKLFTVIGGDGFVAFVFFCMHLLVFWKPVFKEPFITLIKKKLLMNIIFSDQEESQWASKSA